MKKGTIITIIIIIAVIIIAWIAYQASSGNPTSTTATSTTTGIATTTPTLDQTLSDGTVSLSYPSSDFGLATPQQPITKNSYIPPCDPGFDDCLYYIGTTYAGTNFDSAGIGITKRTSFATQTQCLNNEPTGYNGLTPTITTYSSYSISEFGSQAHPISNAGAGHFASDIVYRVATTAGCYEFDTRVSQSDYGNYPSGSIQQFTTAEQAALQSEILQILDTLTLPSSTSVAFPQS